ncbi:MAG TPA: SigB/SigF/SigG family RNA polymerase sigma factor [Solirubrobacter sp.]
MSATARSRWGDGREHWYRSRRAHERRLFADYAIARSPAARDAILEQFMPLARQLARRYSHAEDIEDLEQVAAIGLVKAIERFDPERGLAFSSFAFPTIVGELKRHLRDHGWSVRPPRDVQELAARLDHLTKTLLTELGRSPTVGELAEHTDRTVEQVLEALRAATARRAVSLDAPLQDDDAHGSQGREIAVDDAGFGTAENAVLLDGLLGALTPRERQVLSLRFQQDLTQAQIGAIVGVSQMQVSRVIRNAIATLQATVVIDR